MRTPSSAGPGAPAGLQVGGGTAKKAEGYYGLTSTSGEYLCAREQNEVSAEEYLASLLMDERTSFSGAKTGFDWSLYSFSKSPAATAEAAVGCFWPTLLFVFKKAYLITNGATGISSY
ncbi:hypothetical protein [Pseudomonas sp. BN411]|uniref:hypothetical protein n=1 Tax=Pseudomonas sp. BN411 TaxID=2567887 RepID=UPI0024538044|nr:hypothetical protein [Pseudomonas sp. BN411]MDH4560211.1 hypothetical protein [Pseudomonas sp. BN411]